MDPFAPPFLFWIRSYTQIDGQLFSYSFTADGVQSPLTLETRVITHNPIVPVSIPVTQPPEIYEPPAPPAIVTPEPGTVVMMAIGCALLFGRRALKRRK